MPKPKLKFVVAQCSEDDTDLECGGGYLSEEQIIVVYFCPTCQSYYPTVNGKFLDGTWKMLDAETAAKLNFQLLSAGEE